MTIKGSSSLMAIRQNRSNDILLLFLACGGRKIEGYKKLKSSYFLIEKRYKISSYTWPFNFWGPEDPSFFSDLESLLYEGMVDRTLSFRKNEPIHHPYTLSMMGKDRFTELVKRSNKKDMEFIPETIVWLRLPSRFSVNESMVEAKNLCNTYGSYRYESQIRRIRHTPNHFQNSLEKIVDLYRRMGFDVHEKLENGKGVIWLSIPQEFAKKRYKYQEVSQSAITETLKKINVDELFDTTYTYYLLEKMEIVDREEVEKQLSNVVALIQRNMKNGSMKEEYTKRMRELMSLCDVTDVNKKRRLCLTIQEDYSELSLDDEAKKALKEKYDMQFTPEHYYAYWHLLQPYELRDALQWFTVDTLYTKLF